MGYFDEIMYKAAHRANMKYGIFNEGDYYEPFEDYKILHCGKCKKRKEWIRFIATYTQEEMASLIEDYARKHPDLNEFEVRDAVYSIMPPKNKRNDFGKVGVSCDCQKAVLNGTSRNERDAETIARIKENRYACFQAPALHYETFKRWGVDDNKHLKAVKKYCDMFAKMNEEGKGLVLCGAKGAGKSIAAICLANELLNRGFTVRFKVQPEITFSDFNTRQKMIDEIIDVNVLIIDEFDLEEISSYGRDILFMIIEKRIKAKRPTIFTSNITKKGILNPSNAADRRICQRLADEQYFYIVEDSSHNYRKRD